MAKDILPIAVIGAGPVGLAAAAHLAQRGERFIVFESGETAGATVRQWAHVRMFSPWSYNVDLASMRLLTAQGWTMPTATESADAYPTGDDLVARYLRPLSQHPQIAPHVRYDARVLGIGRLGLDRTKTGGRESAPFVLRVAGARGDGELDILARAVIDASGTFRTPNPLGAHGYPAIGELTLSRSDADVDGQRDGDRQIEIEYGLPDVLGSARARYAGRRVLVAGSGHSAMNVLLDLGQLAAVDAETEANATHVTWVVRRSNLNTLYGAGDRDQLPERGRLGTRLHTLVDSGHLHVVTDFRITRVTRTPDGIVASNGTRDLAPSTSSSPPPDSALTSTSPASCASPSTPSSKARPPSRR